MTFNTTEHARYLLTRRAYTRTHTHTHRVLFTLQKNIYRAKTDKKTNKYYKNITTLQIFVLPLVMFLFFMCEEEKVQSRTSGKGYIYKVVAICFSGSTFNPLFPVYDEEIHQAFCLEDFGWHSSVTVRVCIGTYCKKIYIMYICQEILIL